jgi:hypothetical protein
VTLEERQFYTREVLLAWAEKCPGGALVLSSAQYATLLHWMREVPLHVVLRAIRDMKPLATHKPLTYAGPAVQEAMQHWVRGQTS